MPKLVAYYVLADGMSVELDTQRNRILKHIKETKSEVIAEFSEHSNDKRSDLQELKKAVDTCRIHNAKLAVAAFDDVPRKFRFIMILLCQGVDCVVIGDQKSSSYEASELIGAYWR